VVGAGCSFKQPLQQFHVSAALEHSSGTYRQLRTLQV
jgi:hypothetical protein